MFCPQCGSACADGDRFCSCCGSSLSTGSSPEATTRKGALWPPILIMLAMIAVSLTVYLLTAPAQRAASDTPWFHMVGQTLYFDADAYTGGSELVVPETIDGKTVLFIGEGCFSGCDILTTVILPGSVVRIEEAAFYRCTSLRGVFIPAHVTSVGTGAFAECDALEAVCFAAAPLEIGDSAFDACDTLHFIFFPGSYEQWKRLYQEDISPSTYICCSDGIFPQSD